MGKWEDTGRILRWEDTQGQLGGYSGASRRILGGKWEDFEKIRKGQKIEKGRKNGEEAEKNEM